ncbi:hypothetical protein G6L94_09330 [Agrobacterium rhizogenes]|uniref:hypothetical protein n=1 Tax=Rhizobium TaxID=379 RepID=UPI00114648C6|nr:MULTISPECIES: hypothetical protein [Rhizobium]NTG41062.1 hypothetical protein [Rhizobium rhizogenes]NTG86379.1 hypothetical protein [Rhizobium rhizogenes]NTH18573.1 hypothetical protein [Rhizobium rhizogenes]NTH31547.1 hypothetical protein [Rhizobium rhizogenes]NTI48512.1 hypothetical protein [Rhizobium rhizogenes]
MLAFHPEAIPDEQEYLIGKENTSRHKEHPVSGIVWLIEKLVQSSRNAKSEKHQNTIENSHIEEGWYANCGNQKTSIAIDANIIENFIHGLLQLSILRDELA